MNLLKKVNHHQKVVKAQNQAYVKNLNKAKGTTQETKKKTVQVIKKEKAMEIKQKTVQEEIKQKTTKKIK